MARWNTIARGGAVLAVATLALAACSSGDDPESSETAGGGGGSTDPLIVGSLLPLTGSLAFLGPPEVAGVDLAIKEINEAGGVLGSPVEVVHSDSSDTANPQIAAQSVADMISDGVSAIVGAASSSVSLNVVDDIAAAEVVQISPANTSTALSGYSPYYFRVAPPDTVQGSALANLIIDDGYSSVGILVFEDDYGTSLRDVIVGVMDENGVDVTYGTTETFDPTASNYTAEVQAIMATNPEAIVLIAFEQTVQVLPELLGAGFSAENLYMVDGNTADYSADFDPGTLVGAKGTIPGANPTEDFQELLNSVAPEPLTSFAYGPESYDATMLVALAAIKAGATDGPSIQANLAAVSGSTGGTECDTFSACVELLDAGEEITYVAVSGSGPINEDNDPSSAFIGVYEYDENNVPVWVDAVFGEV